MNQVRVKRGLALLMIALGVVVGLMWYETRDSYIQFTGGPQVDWAFGQGRLWLASLPAGSAFSSSGGLGMWLNMIRVGSGGVVGVPLWMLLVGLLLTAATLTHTRRPRGGVCGACGYSRSGLAIDVACPECGKRPQDIAPLRGWSASLVRVAMVGQGLGAAWLAFLALALVVSAELGAGAVVGAGACAELTLLVWTIRRWKRLSDGKQVRRLALALLSWGLVPAIMVAAVVLALALSRSLDESL